MGHLGFLGWVQQHHCSTCCWCLCCPFCYMQPVVCLLQVVLTAWQYHQGTQNNGVPTYENAKVAAAYLSNAYPNLPSRSSCPHLAACAAVGTVSLKGVHTSSGSILVMVLHCWRYEAGRQSECYHCLVLYTPVQKASVLACHCMSDGHPLTS